MQAYGLPLDTNDLPLHHVIDMSALELYGAGDVIGDWYFSNPTGLDQTHGKADNDLEEIGSVSAPGGRLQVRGLCGVSADSEFGLGKKMNRIRRAGDAVKTPCFLANGTSYASRGVACFVGHGASESRRTA